MRGSYKSVLCLTSIIALLFICSESIASIDRSIINLYKKYNTLLSHAYSTSRYRFVPAVVLFVGHNTSINYTKLYIVASVDSNEFVRTIVVNILGYRKCLSQWEHIACIKYKLQRPYIFQLCNKVTCNIWYHLMRMLHIIIYMHLMFYVMLIRWVGKCDKP